MEEQLISALVGSLVTVAIAILASRYYYERPIVLPDIRWSGTYPAIVIKNAGKSPSKSLKIKFVLNGKVVLCNEIYPLLPGKFRVWFIPTSTENPRNHIDENTLFSSVFEVHIKSWLLWKKHKYNYAKDASLFDDVVEKNWGVKNPW